MISGPVRPISDATMVAAKAVTMLPRWPASTGARRLSAVRTEALASPGAALSLYRLVMAGASLRLINLHVFGTRREQLLVRAGRQHLAFHEQHNLVVSFDRCDF